MTEPIAFQNLSPRHGLPLLFAAQAQKEVVLNESLARIDGLLHPSVEGELAEPPADPQEGLCWLVAVPAAGAWEGHDGAIATFSGGDWLFVGPRDGMTCWQAATRQRLLYDNGWMAPARPALPTGGGTIDSEARGTLEAIVNALTEAGFFPPS